MMKKKNNWPLKNQVIFMKRLSVLLDQGYSINQALEFLEIQLEDASKGSLKESIQLLKEGDAIYDLFKALEFHPQVLSYLYFAEQHGDVSFALREGSTILQRKNENQEKLKKLIRYPIFLFLFVTIMFIMIENVLLPQFKTMYSSMNSESSFLLQLLFNFSVGAKLFVGVLFIIFVAFTIYYYVHYRHLPAGEQADLILKIPFLKTVWILWNSHFFSVQLSNLLKGGLSIFDALTLFEAQQHSRFFHEEGSKIKNLLLTGSRLDTIIEERPYYEKELAHIIFHGQTNGNLEKELYHYSQYVVQRIEDKTSIILSVLQPCLLSFIGILIVFMYIAMLLPMFNLIQSI